MLLAIVGYVFQRYVSHLKILWPFHLQSRFIRFMLCNCEVMVFKRFKRHCHLSPQKPFPLIKSNSMCKFDFYKVSLLYESTPGRSHFDVKRSSNSFSYMRYFGVNDTTLERKNACLWIKLSQSQDCYLTKPSTVFFLDRLFIVIKHSRTFPFYWKRHFVPLLD